MKRLAVTLVVLLAAAALGAQNAAFDVTSVKPDNSGSGMVRMIPAANGLGATDAIYRRPTNRPAGRFV
jgi:hypothetical protein